MSTNVTTQIIDDPRDWSDLDEFEHKDTFAFGDYDVFAFGPSSKPEAKAWKGHHSEKGIWGADVTWSQRPKNRFFVIEAKSLKKARRGVYKTDVATEDEDLERTINQSRSLVTQSVDDESPISEATWKRVRDFLLILVAVSRKAFDVRLPIPDVNPAGDGAIDLFWRLDGYQLLLNFPAELSEPITYYGQTIAGDRTIAGRTTPHDERPDLVAWLIQKKS